MAGRGSTTSSTAKAYRRAYLPAMSEEWGPLGFALMPARAVLPGGSTPYDVRVPEIPASQINQVRPTNWQGLQLRQYQCLLSREWNMPWSSSLMAEQKRKYVQLQNHKPQGGMGIGKLKNLNVNAQPNFSNLLARATAFGKVQNRVPAQ